jgi:hypothetical protein
MHLLFINHNGKDDKNRPNTLKILNLINKNMSILKQLDVSMKIFAMTNTQISDNSATIKEYKIKSFPTLIIYESGDMTKNTIVEGYNDIYNVYNNEITRIKKSYNDDRSQHTTIDIDDSNIDGIDSMEYIMSQIGNPDDDKREEGSTGDDAMSEDDIKKGMSKFNRKSSVLTHDKSKNKVDIPAPSNSNTNNDEMEEMMMQRMISNINN